MGATTSCEEAVGGVAIEAEDVDDRTEELSRLREEVAALRMENEVLRDSSRFLDDVTETLWPYVSTFVTNAIIDNVEPALQEALPVYLRGVQFDRERCSLGSKPCRFKRVSADLTTSGLGDSKNLVVRLSPEWEGDEATMVLSFKGYHLGVKSMKARGTLIVELLDVTASFPNIFSGMRLFFENPPEVSFDFRGISKVLNIGVLKAKLLAVVADQIRSLLVLPRRLGVPFGPEVDVFDVNRPFPEGVLWLSAGMAGGLSSKSAYLRVDFGATTLASPAPWLATAQGKQPAEEWRVPLVVASKAHQNISICLYSSSDDQLGSAELRVEEVIGWERSATPVQFNDAKGNACGTMVFCCDWKPLSDKAHEGHLLQSWELPPTPTPRPEAVLRPARGWQPSVAMVFAGIYSATGVTGVHEQGTEHWVELKCTSLLGGCTMKSLDALVVPAEVSKKETWKTAGRRSGDGQQDSEAKRTLARKLDLLQKYHMSDADLSAVLEVDQGMLQSCRAPSCGSLRDDRAGEGALATESGDHTPPNNRRADPGTLDLHWDEGFEYFLADPRSAVLSFDVRRRAPAAKEPQSLGSYEFKVDELLGAPRRTIRRKVPLGSAGAALRLRLQLVFFGGAASRLASK